MNKVLLGDCLIESDKIESGSVDLILTDLPYGTISGQGNSPAAKQYGFKNADWDLAIEPKKVYEIANRILRKKGKMVLFCQEPYTSRLVNDAIPNIPFGLKMMWEKDSYGSHLKCNKAPLGYFEEILIFSKRDDKNDGHPLRTYFESERKKTKLSYKEINEKCFNSASNGGGMASNILTPVKIGWTFPTKEKYEALQKIGICSRHYEELSEIDKNFKSQFASTFNLWEGKKYKSNILKYKKDYQGLHPTQKPVLLLEDLIKTFSNEGDLVVDLTAGSGSTAIACLNTKRNYIVIEKEIEYYDTIINRIKTYHHQPIFF